MTQENGKGVKSCVFTIRRQQKKVWADRTNGPRVAGAQAPKKHLKSDRGNFPSNSDLCEKIAIFQNLRWGNVNTAKTVIDRDEWFFHGTKSPSWHPETFILVTPIPPEGGDMGPQSFAIWCFSQKPVGTILDRKESFQRGLNIRPIKQVH